MNEVHDHPDYAKKRRGQTLLFPQSAQSLCERIGLNWWAAIQLHAGRWLSFDPETTIAMTETEEAELRFVGSLVTGGCNSDLLAELLNKLERPYCYDGRRIYYDWLERRWRLLPQTWPGAPETVFAEWLIALAADKDITRLKQIKTEVEQTIQSLR